MRPEHALALGLLQGVTEFLPVSSSGHLALAQALLSGFRQPGVLFDALLHGGTLLAVVIHYRRDLGRLLCAPLPGGRREERALLGLLALGSLPAAAAGIGLQRFFEGLYGQPAVVGACLLITAALLAAAGRSRGERTRLTPWDALWVGLAQAGAIAPGISRSGATIAVGMLRGVRPEEAARFSFLLSVPAVLGAVGVEGTHLLRGAGFEASWLLGAAVAFASGLACLRLLLYAAARRRLGWFAGYCALLGTLTLGIAWRR